MKINVDGSFLEQTSRMGSGGLIRNNAGEWLADFSCSDGSGDVLLVELMAINHGLSLAWGMGFKKVECKTDSLDDVSLLKADVPNNFHMHAFHIKQIFDWLKKPWEVSINHVFREANSATDFLARMESSFACYHYWHDPPIEMGHLLLRDSIDDSIG